ncbi:MAG: sigma-70 family RNA polymerase sigma factor [Xanthomonadales bacterium]|nr:sigma-70 family RNA polymerase sigma factor [Xanthomonadales bacterium]
MNPGRPHSRGAEALIVGLARTGDRDAFAELVRRRQGWVRNLMRRLSNDPDLADDLSQQAFLQAWRRIALLRDSSRFGPWLKRIAVNTWLQHIRKSDALRDAKEHDDNIGGQTESPDKSLDLDRALATLSPQERMCLVLSYQEGMSHSEISDWLKMPLGTVKSHIRRGTGRLKTLLSGEDAGGSEKVT